MPVKEFDSIAGLKVIDLPHFVDDRGFLMEILRVNCPNHRVPGDEFGHAVAPDIQQVYLVINPTPTVRAYHAHEHLIDYFCVVKGSAIFGFADDREGEVHDLGEWGGVVEAWLDARSRVNVQRIVVSDRKPQLIVVPAGVYHGWASLEPDTILVSVASHRYNTKSPDERRIPPDYLDAIFPNGSPWTIEGK